MSTTFHGADIHLSLTSCTLSFLCPTGWDRLFEVMVYKQWLIKREHSRFLKGLLHLSPGFWTHFRPRGLCRQSCQRSPPRKSYHLRRTSSLRRMGPTLLSPDPWSSCWQHLSRPLHSHTWMWHRCKNINCCLIGHAIFSLTRCCRSFFTTRWCQSNMLEADIAASSQ